MTKSLIFSLLFSAGALLFTGCEKEDEVLQLPEDVEAVANISHALEQAIIDFQSMGNQATDKNLKAVSIQDGTVLPPSNNIIITADTTQITISFGTAGVICGDGRFRKGRIIINASDRPSVTKPGSTLTFTTDNYEVNGYKIELTKIVTYLGTGESNSYPYGYLEYNVSIHNGEIVTPNGDTAIVSINHNRKLIAGENQFSVVGWAVNGESTINVKPGSNSKNYFAPFTDHITINKELVKPLFFRYLISGNVTHNLSNGKLINIDYGSGSLFDITTWRGKQTISSNGVTSELTQN